MKWPGLGWAGLALLSGRARGGIAPFLFFPPLPPKVAIEAIGRSMRRPARGGGRGVGVGRAGKVGGSQKGAAEARSLGARFSPAQQRLVT